MQLSLFGRTFELVGRIEAERDAHGEILEQAPQDRYDNKRNLPLNAHGEGPFCRFRIGSDICAAGVYVILVEGRLMYVGECQNPSRRFGQQGYGRIQPRNCFRGGQVTNCRINHLILEAAKRSQPVELRFCECRDRKAFEKHLLRRLQPSWNAQTGT